MLVSDVLTLLAAGGVPHEELSNLGETPAARPSKYDPLRDPRGAEQLGLALAERLRASEPDRILVWDDVEDAVLAWVVARELGCPVVRAMEADGLLDFDGTIADGDRVVVLADAFRQGRILHGMKALVTVNRASVAAVAVLFDTEELYAEADADDPVIVLLTRRG
jgi:adenine/guanine phosphoribosyltransferase-like PRPP-binding protein